MKTDQQDRIRHWSWTAEHGELPQPTRHGPQRPAPSGAPSPHGTAAGRAGETSAGGKPPTPRPPRLSPGPGLPGSRFKPAPGNRRRRGRREAAPYHGVRGGPRSQPPAAAASCGRHGLGGEAGARVQRVRADSAALPRPAHLRSLLRRQRRRGQELVPGLRDGWGRAGTPRSPGAVAARAWRRAAASSPRPSRGRWWPGRGCPQAVAVAADRVKQPRLPFPGCTCGAVGDVHTPRVRILPPRGSWEGFGSPALAAGNTARLGAGQSCCFRNKLSVLVSVLPALPRSSV